MTQLGEVILPVTRQPPGAYDVSTGQWIDGAGPPFEFTVVASVQPVTPALIDMVEEGARVSARFSAYAEVDQPEILIGSIALGTRPDRVEYDGEFYWAQSIGDWTTDTDGIPHHEYILLSVGEDEPDV